MIFVYVYLNLSFHQNYSRAHCFSLQLLCCF